MKTYKVNEMFLSVQAEGRNAGRAAVFVRFSGCNLKCPFCDTDHAPYKEMTKADIEAEIDRLDPTGAAMVVFTGGEPTLQLDQHEIIAAGRFKAMETNGIIPAPTWINWVTISPKTKLTRDELLHANEIKVLYGWFDDSYLAEIYETTKLSTPFLFLQPTADHDNKFDPMPTIDYIKKHPVWRLSLQFHKLFNIR